MKKIVVLLFTLLIACPPAQAKDLEHSPRRVIEESFYLVAPEDREEFVGIYKTRLYPFWNEMRRMGIIKDEYRMFSQRLHTKEPAWTFKTVVHFKNYEAVDRWLEVRDKVFERLFPGEGGYKGARKKVDALHPHDKHWDEFIREISLKE